VPTTVANPNKAGINTTATVAKLVKELVTMAGSKLKNGFQQLIFQKK
jgi:hypothetical protein